MLKFVKDLNVSGRILAVLSETTYLRKLGKIERKETKMRVVCGSNNRESTRYSSIKDKALTNKLFTDITDEEFIKNYPNQCEKFKRRFKTEYNNLLSKKNS